MDKGGSVARGMTLVELVVSMGILVFLLGVVYGLMGNARSAFSDMSATTGLRDTLRLVVQKLDFELRNTHYDAANNDAHTKIIAAVGPNGSNAIRFSVPVTYAVDQAFLISADATTPGAPANWGAPLTWGCTVRNPNTCTHANYKFVQYALNGSGQLVRSVLGPGPMNTVYGSVVIGSDIRSFNISQAGTLDMLTVDITARRTSETSRTITEQVSQNVWPKN